MREKKRSVPRWRESASANWMKRDAEMEQKQQQQQSNIESETQFGERVGKRERENKWRDNLHK